MFKEMFTFLNDLHKSGFTNHHAADMHGGPRALQSEFGLTKFQAVNIFKAWLETF